MELLLDDIKQRWKGTEPELTVDNIFTDSSFQ